MREILYIDYGEIRDMLLEEDDEVENIKYPIISVNILDVIVPCVLDTGSQASVMREEVFACCSINMKWPMLPMQNTKLRGAVLGKFIDVKHQSQIEFVCQEHKFTAIFIIAANLSVEAILGVDFLHKYQVSINLRIGFATFISGEKSVNVNFDDSIREGGEPIESLRLTVDPGQHCNGPHRCDVYSHENLHELRINLDETINSKTAHIQDERVRNALRAVLDKNKRTFSGCTGTIKGFTYKFQVIPHKPFFVPPHNIPLIKREVVENEIESMLQQGVIEPGVSSYNNPILCLPKKDGSVRLVLDSRQINTIIATETDRPETLDQLLQKFHGVQVLTSVDMRASFWQVELHPECRKYTAFLYLGRCYVFRKLPFGLNVSSSAFIRALSTVLPEQLRKRVTLYVDDILVAEKSWDEHNKVLDQVLEAFNRHNVTINLSKSDFGRKEIKFLGHIVTPTGIRPDPEKLDAVREYPPPRTKKRLRAFLGLINFYKRFIMMEGLTTPRLCSLTGKRTPWKWDAEAQNEFETLKNTLLSAPLLIHPDLSREFCMSTDSSKCGLGVVLFQEFKEGDEVIAKPIAFASRVLSKTEQRYGVTELEALGIVWGFKKYRYYLYGRMTKVYTDHKALQFLTTAKLSHRRLKRWAVFLQEFKFKIIYIPGPQNIVADALSRGPIGLTKYIDEELNENNIDIMYMTGVAFENYVGNALQNLRKEQDKDPILKVLKQKLQNDPEVSFKSFYLLKDDVLFYRKHPDKQNWLAYIPEDLINKLIWYFHLSYGHFGARKCYRKLAESVYFINMEKRVRKLLRTCKVCQKAKSSTVSHQAPLYPIVPARLREFGATDLFGPLPRTLSGYQYVFVATELVSKYVTFTPLRKATAKTVSAAFVKHFLADVSHVEKIIADNGPQYRSKVWQAMLRRRKIKTVYISRYHPASNPAERVIKELRKMCRIYCHRQHRSWDVYLKSFQDIINEMPHGATGMCPITVLKNQSPPDRVREFVNFPSSRRPRHSEIVESAIKHIKKGALARQRLQKGKIRSLVLKPADRVLIKSHRLSKKHRFLASKFFNVYAGPFRVRRVIHPNAVEIETIRGRKSRGVHHISNIKPLKE